jgi:UDP-N-acetylmuramyl pentapeptide phosphotransferase/UDP-N-acetylglucosamine-1-phosphate transferase
MPWWATAYAMVLAGLSASGLLDDMRDGRSRWYLLTGSLSAVFSLAMVFAYWTAPLAQALGFWIAVMLTYAIGWDTWSTALDLRSIEHDPDLSDDERGLYGSFGVIFSAAILAPAYGCGLLVLLDHAGS